MKVLTLIRHAKSSWKDPDCADFDRPLTKRGKNQAQTMGGWLRKKGVRPSLIVSSPAKRAISTMKRIVAELGLPEKMIVRDKCLYEGDSHELLGFVKGIDDIHEEVMICGHNPALTDFCHSLAGYSVDNLPTCGAVTIDFMVDSWRDVKDGSGRILSWECPKKTSLTDVEQRNL